MQTEIVIAPLSVCTPQLNCTCTAVTPVIKNRSYKTSYSRPIGCHEQLSEYILLLLSSVADPSRSRVVYICFMAANLQTTTNRIGINSNVLEIITASYVAEVIRPIKRTTNDQASLHFTPSSILSLEAHPPLVNECVKVASHSQSQAQDYIVNLILVSPTNQPTYEYHMMGPVD